MSFGGNKMSEIAFDVDDTLIVPNCAFEAETGAGIPDQLDLKAVGLCKR